MRSKTFITMMATDQRSLFCFGLGFSASVLARRLLERGWRVAGTSRQPKTPTSHDSIAWFPFNREGLLSPDGIRALSRATHVLVSVPPDAQGDLALQVCRQSLAQAVRLGWIGYLSSTSVYGDTGGAPVGEDSPLRPSSPRGEWRVEAERGWLEFGRENAVAVQIFRLAGIYGPGRSVFDRLRQGQAQRIDRPGHRFNRIHVGDVAATLEASITRPRAGGIYNLADDEPTEPEKVVAFAAQLLGVPPPPLLVFDEAAPKMSLMARSFWDDNRIVVNRRIKGELRVQLAYPNFREGLRAIFACETS